MSTKKVPLSFKPKQLTKKLLQNLQDRSRYVVSNRFGLDGDGERRTLDSIGQEYKITRERVRQIENFALNAIRKSSSFQEAKGVFEEISTLLHSLGGIVEEKHLLSQASSDRLTQNHVHLYLVLGDQFSKIKDDEHFKTHWVVDHETGDLVKKILKDIHESIGQGDLISENEILQKILGHESAAKIKTEHKTNEAARRWLELSNKIAPNPLGEWGQADSSAVKTRGVKDYAYLVMRKHGSPMHFREVAQSIEKIFGRKVHTATCHNELIKDERFVLVGRGVYALKEWGYKKGVVRDVIADILKAEGPLTKEEVIEKVLKERYLKKNTILVNLQNQKHFKKLADGRYTTK